MANGSGLLLLIVRGGPGITVNEGARQRAVDQDGELAGGRGDGLRFPDAEREASIKGAEGGLRLADRFGGEAERRRGAIGGRLCAGPEQAAARDFVIRGEGQPRGEVLLGGPPRHVGSDLGDGLETRVRAKAIDLRQVDAAGSGVAGAASAAVSVLRCASMAASQAASWA